MNTSSSAFKDVPVMGHSTLKSIFLNIRGIYSDTKNLQPGRKKQCEEQHEATLP